MVEAIQEYFLPCLINMVTVIYINKKILNCKLELNIKNCVWIMLLVLSSIINFVYINNFARFLISTIYIMFFSKLIFKRSLYKTIFSVVIEQIILFISELIYALLIIVFLKFDSTLLASIAQGSLITNLIISIIAIILINIKWIKKLSNKIINYIDKIKQKNKYILALIFIITLNILLAVTYVNSNNLIMVIANVIMITVYSYILYLLLNEKNENLKFREENKNLLDNLNEYEKMLDYQRVNNHENKNQLLVIKSMVNKSNKKLQSYIDEIIKETREDNEILYTKAKRIPSGGLQGLVYQKMLSMQEKNINIDLNVSTEVRKINLSNLSAKTNYDICRAIGIIIDNAMEETVKIKNKEISISMYKDEDYFVIEVANKCKELPDLNKIDNKGYTTKEKGHGYGLSLLKNICDGNKDIINERKIIGDIFIQIIKIKM